MLAYLDQNILGYIRENKICGEAPGMTWVYSEVHFEEIARGGMTELLDVLAEIGAKRIEWNPGPNSLADPHGAYEAFLSARAETPYDESVHETMLAGLFGSQDQESIATLGERHEANLTALGEIIGDPAFDPADLAKGMAPLQEILQENSRPLADLRKGLGLPHGKASLAEATDDPIEKLEEMLRAKAPEFSLARMMQAAGIPNEPTFEAIAALHTFLNFLGYAPDKNLPRAESCANILADGRHLAYASKCHFLITDDRRLKSKAKAIYKYFKLPIIVIDFEIPKSGAITFSCRKEDSGPYG